MTKLENPTNNKENKAKIVDEIVEKLRSNGVAIAEYKHLTAEQMTKLRVEGLKENVEIKVFKNSLARRAINDNADYKKLEAFLTQQNVFLFSEDPIAPAKLVAKFAKKNDKFFLKAGIYGGKVLDTQGINEIAALPSKTDLYSMFASSLIYPLRQFMSAVSEVAKTKTE